MSTKKRALLIIMDGWGWREERDGNAVLQAETPTFDRLWKEFPHTLITASGPYVGLPDGQMGNSEVGHLNLGAGRVVNQDIVRIDAAIEDGSFASNQTWCDAMNRARDTGKLHFMGLLSDGGVHSHQDHLHAMIRMAASHGVQQLFVHAILDGRDTRPDGGTDYLAALGQKLTDAGVGSIATVIGRYHSMDRDRRWDRTEKAYNLIVSGIGVENADAVDAVRASYDQGVLDEFVGPIVVDQNGLIADGDTVVFFNFRADRARQITRALTDNPFDGFVREQRVDVNYVCMTRYAETFDLPIIFPPLARKNILAEVSSVAGKTNLRIAETEKYAHVTYFFNGGDEEEWTGEHRILVPSPKVRTYDLQPEMSAVQIAEALLGEIESDRHDYIICNFANPDMVGHTGVMQAAVRACETVDECVGRIVAAIDLDKYVVIVTSDHGNAEQMIDYENGGPHTAHTTNRVPCILLDPSYDGALIDDGALRDIAPTICNYIGVDVPPEMTGRDLRAD